MSLREQLPPVYDADLAFAWRTRDIPYCKNVYELLHASDAPFKNGIEWFDPQAIALSQSPFRVEGIPFVGQNINDSWEAFMPG